MTNPAARVIVPVPPTVAVAGAITVILPADVDAESLVMNVCAIGRHPAASHSAIRIRVQVEGHGLSPLSIIELDICYCHDINKTMAKEVIV
jgi:hypothetical protein